MGGVSAPVETVTVKTDAVDGAVVYMLQATEMVLRLNDRQDTGFSTMLREGAAELYRAAYCPDQEDSSAFYEDGTTWAELQSVARSCADRWMRAK